MKLSLRVKLPENLSRWMIGRKELREQKKSAVEIQTTSNEVDAQKKIISYSGAMWRKIYDDATRNKLLTLDERSALTTAMKIPNKIPEPFQCVKLLRLLNRLEENGLTYVPDLTP